MSQRRFEMDQYRKALARTRQGDSDRDITRSRLMGRMEMARPRGSDRHAGERTTANDTTAHQGHDRTWHGGQYGRLGD